MLASCLRGENMTNTLFINYLISFFIYCFIGWVWECILVSTREKKFINRGFLYGPWLPIYGFGALLILFTTYKWTHSFIQVFILGMMSATILEYITGSVMEMMFHVRYWDYSKEKYNLNGHICLTSSIAWGITSLLLVYLVHPPLMKFLSHFSFNTRMILFAILLILFVIDTILSVNAAINLKNLLSSLQVELRIKQNIQSALRSIKMQHISTDIIREKITDIESILEDKLKNEKEHIFSRQSRNQIWQKYEDRKERILVQLEEGINATINSIVLNQYENPLNKTQIESVIYSLNQVKKTISKAKEQPLNHRNKPFQKAISMLERNPGSKSIQYKKALNELLTFKKKDKKKSEEIK